MVRTRKTTLGAVIAKFYSPPPLPTPPMNKAWRRRYSLPQEIDSQSWYYECKGRIEVVVEFRGPEGNYLGTKHVNIQASRLKRSLARMDRRKSQTVRSTPRR